ncbi:MAG: phosphatase PAP2 family protein [Gemmatimonadaceae bacterium]|nr:phosphatase PAP2 family protein [Gemmatimonadaceae bacterium]
MKIVHRPRKKPRNLESHTVLLIGLSSAAIAACAKVGEDVFNNESGPFDEAVRNFVLIHQNTAVRDSFLIITRVASPSVIIPITAAVGAWLWRQRGLPIAGAVVMSPAISLAIFLAVKRLYKRKRPEGGARLHELTYAFPSGHAAASAAIFGTTAYVLWREEMLPRSGAAALAILAPLFVGASRVYLDVHWSTDVLGGWSVGALVAALSGHVYEKTRTETRRSHRYR